MGYVQTSNYEGPERRMEDPWRTEMEKRVAGIEADVTTIKTDVADVKKEVTEVKKEGAANTKMTEEVLENTAAIRTAVVRGRWFGRTVTAIVAWFLRTVRKVANYLYPIIAIAVAIAAFFGITWKGNPPP